MQFNEQTLVMYVEARLAEFRREIIPAAERRQEARRHAAAGRHGRLMHGRQAVERWLGERLIGAGERLRAGALTDPCLTPR